MSAVLDMVHTLAGFQRFLPNHLQTAKPMQPMYVPSRTYNCEETTFKHNIILSPYSVPKRDDMLIVIPFFNPCNSVRMLQNLLLVRNKLEQSQIPYVVAHCLFPDSCHVMPNAESYITVRTSSYAFLKENIANIVIRKLNDKYMKFMILDGDVMFENKNWYDEASSMLDVVDIIQPYTEYKNLDSNFHNIISQGEGTFYNLLTVLDNTHDTTRGHPGYALAFTMRYYETHGYPDETVIGAGDTLTCSIALGQRLFDGHHNSKHLQYLYDKYHKDIMVKAGYMKGKIYHMYHNTLSNRQYTTRYHILDKYINDDTEYDNIDDILWVPTKPHCINWLVLWK